ncbi:hypothetical protein V8E51_002686 [Hyaloscypha variabilis]
MSHRPVYLVVYKSRVFAAHWTMWIPDYDANTQATANMGKYINVRGDPRNGFVHEFVRNHNMDQCTSPKEIIFLGWTDAANVAVRSSGTNCYADTEATDRLEEGALYVPAPGPSLRSACSSSSGSRNRVQLQNCQTWMTELVGKLVENGLLDARANTIIANAPKN